MSDASVSRRVIYLHGFASSSRSAKAAYFGERLRARHVEFECPDFNEPDFETLSMTRMLEELERVITTGDEPVSLIGSSLGGTLAILSADRFGTSIERLVLLAPAVMFAKPGHHLLPPERVEQWRRDSTMMFFHHAFGEERPLGYAFYEDSWRYDAFNGRMAQQTMIFQGIRDESVDYRTVEAFARVRPNVTLSLVDDDHQLLASLPRIWTDVEAFFGLVA
jgi:pimeloyl-ACP methyl ester carboxylesterase